MRTCGTCTACCTWLYQNSYGHISGNGKPCGFLADNKCSIYSIRPPTCSFYECAWKQNLFPEWMKPNECGILINIVNKNNIQFLDIIETEIPLQNYIKKEIEKFCNENNCGAKITNRKTGEISLFGPQDFLDLFK